MGMRGKLFISILIAALFATIPISCSRRLTECEGPEIDFAGLNAVRNNLTRSGPQAALVIPNPIDATRNPQALANDATVLQAAGGFSLPGLLSAGLLDNNLVKIRIRSTTDDASTLAKPDSSGAYRFAVNDVHYSEAMAYYSIQAMQRYLETLGFSFIKSRPLYVLVRSEDPAGDEETVNAYYEHNYLQPNLPRIMRLIGNTQFAPGIDRDMYWHEMGHFANESISHDVGIDRAADLGAIYTEASALHECTADFMAESLGNKNFIGKWINRNFDPQSPGEPLRWAVDRPGDQMTYDVVSAFDGTGANPERYTVAEWCTRVLWDLRSQLVKEDSKNGAVIAERMVLSAISQLKPDTSIKQFQEALLDTDQDLHCGLHKRSIKNAFSARGYEFDPDQLPDALGLDASPVRGDGSTGEDIVFRFRITNNTGVTARNVRLKLDVRGAGFTPLRYMQGFGDLAPGKSIAVGDGNALGYVYSVGGVFDGSASGRITYRISVLVDNGETAFKDGEIPR